MATPTAEQINGALRGFDLLYGLQLLDYTADELRAQVAVREELKQPAGLLHGGVYAAVAESLASLATALGVAEEGKTARTPLIAITGVSIVAGLVVIFVLAISFTLYFVYGGK